ncbi:YbhB/YbcL family Raf kinase inhibitor-like protein [Janthinobacterium sp.]|uniref:YbhB/YbcL family Raf kinase inhibitor-like protein n=1 Tax=Janthinobacterium sp. TaxID=1871054 RepID=UPI00293D73D9|nr:YbhB/YbcL family Raf kinase inhibitor-like protein [Janthinobacterium sp.]
MSLSLTSPAFAAGAAIPPRHTCDGANISPPLAWSGVPAGTKSLTLIVEDPDAPDPAAPQRIWVHWVLYNLPPGSGGLPEGLRGADFPGGSGEGINDWQRSGYSGPCPPIGRHRYVHKLYALDLMLPRFAKATKMQLELAMRGHILEQAELVGLYERM